VAVAAASYAFSFLLYALILKHYPLNKVKATLNKSTAGTPHALTST